MTSPSVSVGGEGDQPKVGGRVVFYVKHKSIKTQKETVATAYFL